MSPGRWMAVRPASPSATTGLPSAATGMRARPTTTGCRRSSSSTTGLPTSVAGNSEFYCWDIEKLRGKDVSGLPFWKRQQLYIEVIADIRRFNKAYHVVEQWPDDMTFAEFYEHVLSSPLPWGEGVVAKHKYSIDRNWQKVKRSDELDLVVTDFFEGS